MAGRFKFRAKFIYEFEFHIIFDYFYFSNFQVIISDSVRINKDKWNKIIKTQSKISFFIKKLGQGVYGHNGLCERTVAKVSKKHPEKKIATPSKIDTMTGKSDYRTSFVTLQTFQFFILFLQIEYCMCSVTHSFSSNILNILFLKFVVSFCMHFSKAGGAQTR